MTRRLTTVLMPLALLIAFGAVVAVGIMPALAEDPAAAPVSASELAQLSYPNDFAESGIARLVGGRYDYVDLLDPAVSRVEVELRRAAFGSIDARPAAAVLLATNAGGSGTFHDLHLVMRAASGALEPVAQHSLGDRIVLQEVAFAGEVIRVDFTRFAAADGLCCPALNVAREYRLRDGELELERAEEAPALLAIPAGLSVIGWFGSATTSRSILAAAPALESVWGYDPTAASWLLDSRELPKAMRPLIPVERGSALFVVARWATEIPVPLLSAPAACPLNPGPPDPVDPSMIVERPGHGEVLSGAVPIAGRARAFEANVRIRILAADGAVLADTFTTATVGGPWFGDFEAAIPVTVTEETSACVQVFENSAFDGSQVNVVQIGVILRPAP